MGRRAWRRKNREGRQVHDAGRHCNSPSGDEVFRTRDFYALPDAKGDFLGNLSDVEVHEMNFGIARPGRYRMAFESVGGGEFLLLKAKLNAVR